MDELIHWGDPGTLDNKTHRSAAWAEGALDKHTPLAVYEILLCIPFNILHIPRETMRQND